MTDANNEIIIYNTDDGKNYNQDEEELKMLEKTEIQIKESKFRR